MEAQPGMALLPAEVLAHIIAHSLSPPSVSQDFHNAFLAVFSIPDLCVAWALERSSGVHTAAYDWLVR